MTKYEKLYGKPVEHFPNELENVKEKFRLATKQLREFEETHQGYSYEDECTKHEFNQAIAWCVKILEDIDA